MAVADGIGVAATGDGLIGTKLVSYGLNAARECEVLALEVSSGDVACSHSDPAWDNTVTVVGTDGVVYVSPMTGTQRGYDAATGAERWRHDPPRMENYKLIAARGRDLYLTGADGQIQALHIG